ncbi:MAG: hypothetical protein KZQ56_13460, partial [gamma proteobacterium symbiont of Lucinoma myriamae]|nr:hypothetical protein [gamma proteobacterium symbiont of Lucinoma myriamae]
LGREVTLPKQAVIGKPQVANQTCTDPDDYVTQLQRSMVKVHDVARSNLRKSADYQKRYYDTHSKKAQLRYFEVGQLVWLHDPSRKVGVCHKLMNRWKGPYVVIRKLDDLIYLIKKSSKQPVKAYHVDRLMKYQGNNVPQWIVKLLQSKVEEERSQTGDRS